MLPGYLKSGPRDLKLNRVIAVFASRTNVITRRYAVLALGGADPGIVGCRLASVDKLLSVTAMIRAVRRRRGRRFAQPLDAERMTADTGKIGMT
jgi:hypothetical protein